MPSGAAKFRGVPSFPSPHNEPIGRDPRRSGSVALISRGGDLTPPRILERSLHTYSQTLGSHGAARLQCTDNYSSDIPMTPGANARYELYLQLGR
jgi:hypothetical protein